MELKLDGTYFNFTTQFKKMDGDHRVALASSERREKGEKAGGIDDETLTD